MREKQAFITWKKLIQNNIFQKNFYEGEYFIEFLNSFDDKEINFFNILAKYGQEKLTKLVKKINGNDSKDKITLEELRIMADLLDMHNVSPIDYFIYLKDAMKNKNEDKSPIGKRTINECLTIIDEEIKKKNPYIHSFKRRRRHI